MNSKILLAEIVKEMSPPILSHHDPLIYHKAPALYNVLLNNYMILPTIYITLHSMAALSSSHLIAMPSNSNLLFPQLKKFQLVVGCFKRT